MRKLACLFMIAAMGPALIGATWKYPEAKKSDQTDDYFGTKIADPYRALEELDSPETKAWVQAENELTDSVVGAMPERAAVRHRLTELWNYARVSVPFREASWYFFTKNDGLQNQSPLYVQEGLKGFGKLFGK